MNKIFDYSAIASGIILLLLSILTFCDVFGRRFLNSPVTGTIELVEIGMALVAFLAMPRAFYLNANGNLGVNDLCFKGDSVYAATDIGLFKASMNDILHVSC